MSKTDDLRAAVARADEALGCGAMPCRFKVTTGQTTNGRCVCLDHPRAGQALAALYRAAKAAVEPRCEVTTKSNEEVRRTWEATLGLDNVLKTCWCFQCLDEPSMGINNPAMRRYINCPDCHQNDCPRAASHGNACSGSNEPGQDGRR
jgi:hypothetical protein